MELGAAEPELPPEPARSRTLVHARKCVAHGARSPGSALLPTANSASAVPGEGAGGAAGGGGHSPCTLRPLEPANGPLSSLPLPSLPSIWLTPLMVYQASGAGHSCGSQSHVFQSQHVFLSLLKQPPSGDSAAINSRYPASSNHQALGSQKLPAQAGVGKRDPHAGLSPFLRS